MHQTFITTFYNLANNYHALIYTHYSPYSSQKSFSQFHSDFAKPTQVNSNHADFLKSFHAKVGVGYLYKYMIFQDVPREANALKSSPDHKYESD